MKIPDGFVETDIAGYWVNKKGVIFSSKTDMILKQRYWPNGYKFVNLWRNKKYHHRMIHRLVASAFLPNTDTSLDVNHKNGVKDDNRVENLEWCTRSQNIIHSYRTLKRDPPNYGEKHSLSKLKEWEVKHIRLWRKEGFLMREIAKAYNLDTSTVTCICQRKTWKHVE